ncbi:Calretinin [Chelonia mydas]|uniref:Calretinin n=1 Tax=Chelonia mydas TaxID=8469 RepID=M7CCT9_CHEMY|nr:Calretinin [Chelonia mydas]
MAVKQQAPYLHLAELTASQFLDIWKHYDSDVAAHANENINPSAGPLEGTKLADENGSAYLTGNGYIEGKELENFFQELESARKGAGVDSKNGNFAEKMKEFMQKYDKNADGRIEMAELAQILPTEENFLLCFRQHVGSSSEFMEAWRKYDTDRSGYIEANELKGFLSDLLKKANKPYDEPKLQEYTQTILRMFDMNGDGKLGLSEMSRLLPVQENFLLKFQGMKLATEEFNAIFAFYDKDGSGFIDENELDALLKDLYEKHKKHALLPVYNAHALCDLQSPKSFCSGSRVARCPVFNRKVQLKKGTSAQSDLLAGTQSLVAVDGGGARSSPAPPPPYSAVATSYLRRAAAAPSPGFTGESLLIQEMNIQQLTNYRKSIMNLSDGGKLYRTELEIVLCNEPPM